MNKTEILPPKEFTVTQGKNKGGRKHGWKSSHRPLCRSLNIYFYFNQTHVFDSLNKQFYKAFPMSFHFPFNESKCVVLPEGSWKRQHRFLTWCWQEKEWSVSRLSLIGGFAWESPSGLDFTNRTKRKNPIAESFLVFWTSSGKH